VSNLKRTLRILQIIHARAIHIPESLTTIPKHDTTQITHVSLLRKRHASAERITGHIPTTRATERARPHKDPCSITQLRQIRTPRRKTRAEPVARQVAGRVVVELDEDEVGLRERGQRDRGVGVRTLWRRGEVVGLAGVGGEEGAEGARERVVVSGIVCLVVEVEAVEGYVGSEGAEDRQRERPCAGPEEVP